MRLPIEQMSWLPSITPNVRCLLLTQDDDKEYGGPSPGELLEPLFKRSSCSYRVRPFFDLLPEGVWGIE